MCICLYLRNVCHADSPERSALAASIGFLEFFYLFVVLGEALINKIFDQDLALSNYLIDANMSAIAAGLDHTSLQEVSSSVLDSSPWLLPSD